MANSPCSTLEDCRAVVSHLQDVHHGYVIAVIVLSLVIGLPSLFFACVRPWSLFCLRRCMEKQEWTRQLDLEMQEYNATSANNNNNNPRVWSEGEQPFPVANPDAAAPSQREVPEAPAPVFRSLLTGPCLFPPLTGSGGPGAEILSRCEVLRAPAPVFGSQLNGRGLFPSVLGSEWPEESSQSEVLRAPAPNGPGLCPPYFGPRGPGSFVARPGAEECAKRDALRPTSGSQSNGPSLHPPASGPEPSAKSSAQESWQREVDFGVAVRAPPSPPFSTSPACLVRHESVASRFALSDGDSD